MECSLDYAQNVQIILSTVGLGKMASREESRPDFFLAGLNFNHQTNAKILFLFFQPFLFSNSFFLDHHTTFGLSKTDLGTFLFSFSLLGNQRIVTPRYRGTCGPFGITDLCFFESEELLDDFQNLAFSLY